MAQRFSKTITAPLLAIFATQLVLPLVLLLLTLLVKRNQQEIVASGSYTHSITIKLSDIRPAELEEGEITLGGVKYDVADTVTRNGEAYIIAIPDEQETALANNNVRLFERETKGSKSSRQTPFFTFLFHEQPSHWQPLTIAATSIPTGFIQPLLPFTIVGLTGPPPRV